MRTYEVQHPATGKIYEVELSDNPTPEEFKRVAEALKKIGAPPAAPAPGPTPADQNALMEGMVGIERPAEKEAAAIAATPAQPSWREPEYQPAEQPIQPAVPPEPALGVKPPAQPSAVRALDIKDINLMGEPEKPEVKEVVRGPEEEAMLAQPTPEDVMKKAKHRAETGPVKLFIDQIKSGVITLDAAATALVGQGIEALNIDPAMSDKAMEVYLEKMKRAESYEPVIGAWKDVHNIGDAGLRAIEMFAQNLPMFAPSLVSGGLGGVLGRTIATRAMSQIVAGGIARGLTKEAAEKSALDYVMARISLGSAIGAGSSSVGVESGTIYGDIYKETGEKKVGLAAVSGLGAGLLDALPAVMAVNRVLGPSVKKSLVEGLVKRYGKAAAEQFLSEAPTETMQTYIEEAAKAKAANRTLHTEQLVDNLIESFISGGLLGTGMGVVTQAGGEAVGKLVGPKEEKADPILNAPDQALTDELLRRIEARKRAPAKPMAEQEQKLSEKQPEVKKPVEKAPVATGIPLDIVEERGATVENAEPAPAPAEAPPAETPEDIVESWIKTQAAKAQKYKSLKTYEARLGKVMDFIRNGRTPDGKIDPDFLQTLKAVIGTRPLATFLDERAAARGPAKAEAPVAEAPAAEPAPTPSLAPILPPPAQAPAAPAVVPVVPKKAKKVIKKVAPVVAPAPPPVVPVEQAREAPVVKPEPPPEPPKPAEPQPPAPPPVVEPPAPPAEPAPAPQADQVPIVAEERTAKKGIFKKKKTPVDANLELNYRKATDLGYKSRSVEQIMRFSNLKDEAEAQKLNKVANTVEKAYLNADIWEPKQLAAALKEYGDAGVEQRADEKGNPVEGTGKVDDPTLKKWADGIKSALDRDGYDVDGTPTRPGRLATQNVREDAEAYLKDMGLEKITVNKAGDEVFKKPETWEEMDSEEQAEWKKENTYTEKDVQDEIDRTAQEEPVQRKPNEKVERESMADAQLGGLSRMSEKAQLEQNTRRTPEDLEVAQAKAKKRRAKLKKQYPDGMDEETLSPSESNEFMRSIRVKDGLGEERAINNADETDIYSKTKRPAEGETIEKDPVVVTEAWDKVLTDYFGAARPSSVRIKVSPTKSSGKAFGVGEYGELKYNGDGTADVIINDKLPKSELRGTIVHDLAGHFGLPEILVSDKHAFKILLDEFRKDQKLHKETAEKYGAESPQFSRLRERIGIFDDYAAHYAQNKEAVSEAYADARMMEEWMARNVELSDKRLFRPSDTVTQKVVGVLRAAIKRLLSSLGMTDVRQDTIDGIIKKSIARMKERYAPINQTEEGAPPKEPGTDIVEAAPTEPGEGGILFDLKEENKLNMLRRKFVDTHNRLAQVQEAIGGGKRDFMDEHLDTYLKNEIMPGKIKAKLKDFKENYYHPIRDLIAKSGLNMREIGLYLYARHAKEANAHLAKINPKFNEDVVFNGVKQKNPGSGMPDSLADDIIRYFEGNREKLDYLKQIETQVHRLNTFHEAHLINSGLVSKEIVNAWRKAYQDYVPLKGIQEETLTAKGMTPEEILKLQKEFYPSGGGKLKGVSVTYKPKRRLGRTTMANADEIMANLILQAEKDIVLAGKNEVAKSFYDQAVKFKNPNVWEIIDKPPMTEYFNARLGRTVAQVDHEYRQRDDVLFVMIDGKEKAIQIYDEPLARALKNLSSTTSASIPDKVFHAMATVNRYFGATITRFAPEFIITNFERDVQEAMMNIGAEFDRKKVKAMVKKIPGAIKGIYQYTRDKEGGDWKATAEEAARNGMIVEFLNFRDVEATQKRMQRDVENINPKSKYQAIRKYGLIVKDWVEDANTAVENGTRLAFYKTLRDAGYSAERAAQKAKNLTVNFNRKGELGSFINGMYIFANAAIQGNRRMMQVLKTPKGRVILGSLIAAGAANAELARLMGGDDEYDKYDRYSRMKHWMLMNPWSKEGQSLNIPVPYNFGVFYGAGVLLNDMLHGKIDGTEFASTLLSSVVDAFNPLGDGDLGQTLTPTIARPVIDILKNKDYAGRPIKPKDTPWDEFLPESSKYFKGATQFSIETTKKLNELFGGNEWRKSGPLTDISPEVMDYLIKALTGGTGTFVMKGISLGGRMAKLEAPESREIPFVGKVVRKPYVGADKASLYNTWPKLQSVDAEFEGLKEAGDNAKVDEFRKAHENELRAYQLSDSRRKLLTDINARMKVADEKKDEKTLEDLKKRTVEIMLDWKAKMDELDVKVVHK